MNDLAKKLGALRIATCDSCRAKPATLSIRHDGNVLSVHCTEACASKGMRRPASSVPRTPYAKELIIDRLYHVAPENAADGGMYPLSAGTTLFHGISDVNYTFGEIRDFSYVSNNVNPSIGAGIGEKTGGYGTDKLYPRLFELETARNVSLVLVNEGDHGEKIENVKDLDEGYGRDHDGYISSRGEEELRLRGKMSDNYRMVRSYFFPAMPLKEVPESRNEVDLEGNNTGLDGERSYGRWAPVAGFAVETLPFVDRVFSYSLLRQVETAIQSRPLARKYADALMMGAYNLVRRGTTAKIYVAFQQGGTWNFPVYKVEELRCHDHPNVSRVVCAFLVTITVGAKEIAMGGGPLNKLGDDLAFSTLCILWMTNAFNAVLKRNQGIVPRGYVDLRVPYCLAEFFVGMVTQGVQDAWNVDALPGLDERVFYYKLHATIRNHLRPPSGIVFSSPEFVTATLVGSYPLGKVVTGLRNARVDYHPVQMIRHAVLVRSTDLLAHTLKHIEELVKANMQEDATLIYAEHVLTALSDMNLVEDSGNGPVLADDVDWLVRQVSGNRRAWFRTVTVEADDIGWKPVARLTKALVAVLNTNPGVLRHGNLFASFLIASSGTEMHTAVAGELCTGIKDWAAFKQTGRLAWDVFAGVQSWYDAVYEGEAMFSGPLPQRVGWISSILVKQLEREVPWKARVGLESLLVRKSVTKDLIEALIASPYVTQEIFAGLLMLSPAATDKWRMAWILDIDAFSKVETIDFGKMSAAIKHYTLWTFYNPTLSHNPTVHRAMERFAPEDVVIDWCTRGLYSTPRTVQALYARATQPPPSERLVTYEEALRIVGGPRLMTAISAITTPTVGPVEGVSQRVYDRELLRIHALIASASESSRLPKRKGGGGDEASSLSEEGSFSAASSPPSANDDSQDPRVAKALKGAPTTPLISPQTK